jgi:translocator protein
MPEREQTSPPGGRAGRSDAPRPHRTARPTTRASVLALAAFLALTLIASAVGAFTQGDDVGERYLALDLPAWAPPQGAFGLVWPVLYVLIALAAWRVWRAAGDVATARRALSLWLVQLVVNAAWPGVFFGLSAFGWGIVVIVVLDLLVAATIVTFRRWDGWAAALLVPYLLWILYATALNVAVWQLN